MKLKSEFKEKYFIQENGDSLSPTDVFQLHSEQIIKDFTGHQDVKELVIHLNEEVQKCFRLLENAIFDSLD